MRKARARNTPGGLTYFSWEPSPVQRGLIEISLADPATIHERWPAFTTTFASRQTWISELDWGTRRLLPLVGWQLGLAGIDDAHARLVRQETAKSMWVSRVRAAGYEKVLTVLTDAGVDPLVLKGVGLSSLVYPDVGCRPSSDLDVYVGPDGYERTLDAIASVGGTVPPDTERSVPKVRHSLNAVINGLSVDIHWRLLSDRYDLAPDAGLRSRSVGFVLTDRKVRSLGLEDHLLHSLVHGLRPSYVSSVRWVVDSSLIIRTGDLRWELFCELVRSRRLGSSVSLALTILRDQFHVNVPTSVTRELAEADGPLWNRIDNWPRMIHPLWIQNCVSQYLVNYWLGSREWPLTQQLHGYTEFIAPIYNGWRSGWKDEPVAADAAALSLPRGMEWLS